MSIILEERPKQNRGALKSVGVLVVSLETPKVGPPF